ncbi:hypothetical protein J8273_3470 [Carpediemonas membranifera]|uniref:Uncharacterized protein n=1 Tax=Carpediemonas membranifera TaxID=201153 RepID=A0A8J6BXC7_9EUKA|nr:hypothetical protein J8273_3470 [Carpediemonas membranifera]|eukprot:KAG9393336.1 hypothetical protein J8273_3470 [Carpediemonas membranifera]
MNVLVPEIAKMYINPDDVMVVTILVPALAPSMLGASLATVFTALGIDHTLYAREGSVPLAVGLRISTVVVSTTKYTAFIPCMHGSILDKHAVFIASSEPDSEALEEALEQYWLNLDHLSRLERSMLTRFIWLGRDPLAMPEVTSTAVPDDTCWMAVPEIEVDEAR